MRLCEDRERAEEAMGGGVKRQKREQAARVRGRFYYLRDPAAVKYGNLNMSVVGLEKGEHESITGYWRTTTSRSSGS